MMVVEQVSFSSSLNVTPRLLFNSTICGSSRRHSWLEGLPPNAGTASLPDLGILRIRWACPVGSLLGSVVSLANEQRNARSKDRSVGRQEQMIPIDGSTKVQVAASMAESNNQDVS